MPLQSREVVTLNLIYDCWDRDEDETAEEPNAATHILLLPTEIRLKILRYLLQVDRNRHAHTRRVAKADSSELRARNPNRMLEEAIFRHRHGQEIDGSLPIMNTCTAHPTVLRTCKQVYLEGMPILYKQNSFVALQSGIKGLGAKFRNYGIPVWGPLHGSRLFDSSSSLITDGDNSGYKQAAFEPIIAFSTLSAKADTPFYLCSYKDAGDFVHALWIMGVCPFSRTMRYILRLLMQPESRSAKRIDDFIKCALLPYLHNLIVWIEFKYPASDFLLERDALANSKELKIRQRSIIREFMSHNAGSAQRPSIYSYNILCTYLEGIMHQADLCVEQAKFLSAELFYERVLYEACGLVRTRSGRLVIVSTGTREGINRICKLIAVSAFRLCELRSGSLSRDLTRRLKVTMAKLIQSSKSVNKSQPSPSPEHNDKSRPSTEHREQAVTPTQPGEKAAPGTHRSQRNSSHLRELPFLDVTEADEGWTTSTRHTQWHDERMKHTAIAFGQFSNNGEVYAELSAAVHSPLATTRLEPSLAQEMAIANGLLALRLPCASPLWEWNLRLEIMLMRLFAERQDFGNARSSLGRMHANTVLVCNEAKSLNVTGPVWTAFELLAAELTAHVESKDKKKPFVEIADKAMDVVASAWGQYMSLNRGYNGVIWTFRWAD